MDPDDTAYRKSVRNTSIILATVVITIFAALIIPGYLAPAAQIFPKSGSALSENGLSLYVSLNATQVGSNGGLSVDVRLNSTSSQILNVTSADDWALDRNSLWVSPCMSAHDWWPMGISVMKGYYTAENFSTGRSVLGPEPILGCLPVRNPTDGSSSAGGPANYFLFQPHSSNAIVALRNDIEFWPVTTDFYFGVSALNVGQLLAGTYTLVALDEWGDFVILHFGVR